MQAAIDKETALQKLDIEHNAVRNLIQALTDEEMTRPDTIEYGLYWDQELSFKDLLAHLITYEAYAIEAIDAWQRGETHPVIADMQTESGGRRIHYAGIEDRRSLTLQQVLAQWEQTQAALVQTIATLTDETWNEHIGHMMEIILVAPPRPTYRHLPVHIPDVNAYIRSLRGA